MALVELAFVIPFLLIMVLGAVDLGRAWAVQNRMSNAAREAAFIVSPTPQCAGAKRAFDAASAEDTNFSDSVRGTWTLAPVGVSNTAPYAQAVLSPGSSPVFTCDPSRVPGSGNHVKVTVEAEFKAVTPVAGAFFGSGGKATIKRTTEVVLQ